MSPSVRSHSADAAEPAASATKSTLEPDAPARRRAAVAAGIGTAIEYFDFTIYAFLATTLAVVFFPSENATAALLSTWAVYAVSFFLRPVGGILIGHLADRFGRRRAMSIAVLGMATASFLIGVIPGYHTLGAAAAFLLVACRSVQGLSAGGELGTASSYLAEAAPQRRRGARVALVNVGTLAGTLLGTLFISLLRLFADDQAMSDWVWRIPFLCSLPLGLIALLIRLKMTESADFAKVQERDQVKRVPLASMLRSHPRALLAVTTLALTSNAAYWIVFTYLESYFEKQHLMTSVWSSWTTTITLTTALITLPLWARLSDRFGRRPVLITANAAFVVLSYPMFVLMGQSTVMAVASQLLLGQLTTLYLASILATFAEMFPASVRVSGFALGYNIAAVLAGGSAPYIATWLIGVTGSPRSPALFLIVVTAVALAGAVFVARETANKPLPLD
ncbi:MAG TPA: MFS transporter [Amycolatopsis sp.]|jgi:MHS family proline/betaine transporter-like MFS transporter|nr:MFS transporter [Amycolatopsis sp.]